VTFAVHPDAYVTIERVNASAGASGMAADRPDGAAEEGGRWYVVCPRMRV